MATSYSFLGIVFVSLVLLVSPLVNGSTWVEWPMFMFNASHTGQSPAEGPGSAAVVLWRHLLAPCISGPVIAADGTVYVTWYEPYGTSEAWVSALINGQTIWSTPVPQPVPSAGSGNLVLDSVAKLLYGGTGTTEIYALSITNGRLLDGWTWSTPDDSLVTSGPVQWGGLMYVGTSSGQFCSIILAGPVRNVVVVFIYCGLGFYGSGWFDLCASR